MNLTTKKPFRSVRGNKVRNRGKKKYFLISDLPHADWMLTHIEKELNCWVQLVPVEEFATSSGDGKSSDFNNSALAKLRALAGTASERSGLDAGFAISGFFGETSSASILEIQTRHMLFADYQKNKEIYESEYLPFTKPVAGRLKFQSPINIKTAGSSAMLWNTGNLIRKLKRRLTAYCPQCDARTWSPVMKSESFKLGGKTVGGQEAWLCRECNYSRLLDADSDVFFTEPN